MVSRKKASMQNASAALAAQIIKLLGQFVVQTIFVRTLGTRYLGANGLFTNLITFLSFAELGIGAAFSFALYAPIAKKDNKTISAVINLYRKVYNFIGLFILVFGVLVSFFVPMLVKSTNSVPHLRIYFILYLLSSVVSYFFTYNRSLLIANQEGYIDSINQLVFSIVRYVFQIFFLVLFNSYVGFLIVQVLSNFLSNLAITRLTRKKYPFLLDDTKSLPGAELIGELKRNVIGTIASKVGSVVVNGTDNILISKYIGLSVVGLYSNYSLIVAGFTAILNQVFTSIIASFGNLGVMEKDNVKKQVNLFEQFVFFNAFITIFLGIVLFGFFQPFVSIWLGKNYLLGTTTLAYIVINFVLAQFRPALFLVNAYGLFWGYRYKSIVEALTNFGLSFILVKYTNMGIDGVLLGTIIGNILVNSWWDPLILFSGAYHQGIGKFYKKYWLYLLMFLGLLGGENYILNIFHNSIISINGIIGLLIYGTLLSIVTLALLLLLLVGTAGEKSMFKMIKKVLTGGN
ncbi:lipopolysaccharide biosynthesis protein [Lactiplantibacillus argentoratensis]|uniref:lipopolysaccharide biosynthesis protein n=1 Tax=Lactiplantibacillus argentoratensis TaxID=271881 RepID=UPI001B33879C|nr:oligosaccharide flippase family protein [Lactiplantibacillus argentoratensis]MBP5810102.1 oligosaccharide flippase family protein [Lactiplantibacillus argentoratensis]